MVLTTRDDLEIDEDVVADWRGTVTLVLDSVAAAATDAMVTDDRTSLVVLNERGTVPASTDVVAIAPRRRCVVISSTVLEAFRFACVVKL